MTKRDQQYRDYVAEHSESPVSHTPGPWSVFESCAGEYPGIESSEGTIVCWGKADGRDWAGVRGGPANARLIAAAPDMLRCLERILKTPADSDSRWDEIESAIPVVLKAKGLL